MMNFPSQHFFQLLRAGALVLLAAFSFALASARAQTLDAFNPAPQGTVNTIVVQPNGQLLLAGSFTTVGGQSFSNLARLNLDGSLDGSFNPQVKGSVSALVLQTNGAMLVAGGFTSLGGQSRSYLGRINADGSLDATFNPGVSNTVNCLALQNNGQILIGGNFQGAAGQIRKYLARLNSDGSLDASFNPGASSQVLCLALQRDGNIIVGGFFTTLAGQAVNRIARLTPTGSLDTTFAAAANAEPYSLVVQPDGRILVGGHFTTLSGSTCNHVGRLTTSGALDTAFGAGADNIVYGLTLQTDGKVLATGIFTNLAGVAFNGLGRFNADTTPDAAFAAPLLSGTTASGYALALQTNGAILVGGSFTNAAGQMRTNLARFLNTSPAVQTLAFTPTAVTWLRSGTGPEFWETTFDASTNGTVWFSLGAGAPVTGGWGITTAALPATASIRARGFTTSGRYNGSGSVVENYVGPPVIVTQPLSLTNLAGTVAVFNVSAVGPPPLTYQWRKGTTNLVDAPGLTGSSTATLSLSNVFGGNRGAYSVMVSNASGTITSLPATLNVLDPYISSPPAPQWVNAGDTVTLSASAAGTTPLGCQWQQGGTNLPGDIQSTLSLTNVQASNGGLYALVATNVWGSVTSAPAALAINLAAADGFQPGVSSPPYALAVRTDGHIFFGTATGGFGCLEPDGTTDPGINLGISGIQYQTWVQSLAVETNGGLLIGGSFVYFGSAQHDGFGRMTPAGVTDPAFDPGIYGLYPFVSCIGLQPDSKFIMAGCCEKLGWLAQTNLGRMDDTGTLDTSFKASTEQAVYPSQGRIYSLAIQTNGQIVLGGYFTNLCGVLRSHLGRLNADGSLDITFNPGVNGSVDCLLVQADGKLLLGGAFTTVAGQACTNMARLNADGSLDTTFNPGADGTVDTLGLQANGKILVGGYFSHLAGQPCSHLGRLNSDGSVDTTFNPGANGTVYALALQVDGKVLTGGSFTVLGGQPRTDLGRLSNPDAKSQLLSRSGSTLTWTRSGACPEVWRTTFEASTNGTNWNLLGAGTRIPGGWQLTSISAPTNATIRARGFVTGAQGNGSTWFVENQLSTAITNQPVILTGDGGFGIGSNHFGFNIQFLAGQMVIVETSTNLASWLPLTTNADGLSPLNFSDPTPLGKDRRFYRVRIP